MAETSTEAKSSCGPGSPVGRITKSNEIASTETTNLGHSEIGIAVNFATSTTTTTATTESTAASTTISSTTATASSTGITLNSGISGHVGTPTASKSSIGNGSPRSPKNSRRSRVKLTDQQLESASREDLAAKWREQDLFVECLEAQVAAQEGELVCLRESEEKYRQQCSEVTHRERILVRRLASKEQQLLGYVNQITEMRAAAAPAASALRSALLDPAVNILVQKLRQELLSTKAKLEDTQNELSAWKFTPDSNTGKRLMAKCRLLYQENEELGRMIASGRIAKLEGELALQKSFSEEVKKSQSELDEFLQDLDEDVEGMQSTIYFLQQELRKARESVSLLQQENNTFKTASSSLLPTTTQSSDSNLPNGLSAAHPNSVKKEETADENDSRVSPETKAEPIKTELDHESEDSTPQSSASLPARSLNVAESTFPDRLGHDQDESSNDSAALIIKVENEELSDREDDDDEVSAETCETRGPQRQSMRTKEKISTTGTTTTTTKNESVVVGKSNGDEKISTRTSSRRLVRDRTAKRDKSAADSDDERRQHKKKRRESILSLDYNEDDALLLTNGESIQSDPE